MKFGLAYANAGLGVSPEGAAALASLAEETGFESLWTVEHVVVPKAYASQYPYSPSGKMPGPEHSPIPDPLVWLAFVAARTTTIRLCTGVLILPQRPPALTAKEVATLDRLSGGRVTLGVGIGWLAEEFRVLGVPFEERAARTEEAVAALRAFWTEKEPTFHGRFYDFEAAICSPRPVQAGGVPIVIGGHSVAAARRAGRIGDGFFPARIQPDELGALMDEARRAAEDAGRDPAALEFTCGGGFDLDSVRRYQDIGAHRVVIPALVFDAETAKATLERFHDEVMAKL